MKIVHTESTASEDANESDVQKSVTLKGTLRRVHWSEFTRDVHGPKLYGVTLINFGSTVSQEGQFWSVDQRDNSLFKIRIKDLFLLRSNKIFCFHLEYQSKI